MVNLLFIVNMILIPEITNPGKVATGFVDQKLSNNI